MFNKIEIPSSWKEEYTKYPNGKTIWEALSAAMTSFNDFVDEVNGEVQEGLLAIDQAEETLRGEINTLFNNLSTDFALDFSALQDEVDAAVASVADKVSQAQLDAVSAQLAEKANKAQEAWITPTMLNGVTQYGSALIQYRKNSLGEVKFRGSVAVPTTNATIMFNMPTGYKPSQFIRFYVEDTFIEISSVGSVSIKQASVKQFVPLDCISYSV